MITRRQFLTGVCGSLALSGGLGSYAFAVEPGFRLIVTEHDVATPRWPYATPLRIVALSDIHACEPWMPADRIRAIVDKANSLGGDIIVLLGDFTSGLGQLKSGPVPAREWGEALSGLSAPFGVHAVPGNHAIGQIFAALSQVSAPACL